MIVWDNGGDGHVGIVSDLANDKLTVIESNWGNTTDQSRKKWKAEDDNSVTENYGRYTEVEFNLSSGNLNRGAYEFKAYVYPSDKISI